jgi:large subunit ribosomal protein L21
VLADIVSQFRYDKFIIFNNKRRHNYRRKKGHRQQHTILRIVAIGDVKADKKPAATADKASTGEASAAAPAAPAKEKGAITPEEGAGDIAGKPTESPAPANEAEANPPAQSVDAPPKGSGKKSTGSGKTANATSTENAAPAKGGAKKSPKK